MKIAIQTNSQQIFGVAEFCFGLIGVRENGKMEIRGGGRRGGAG